MNRVRYSSRKDEGDDVLSKALRAKKHKHGQSDSDEDDFSNLSFGALNNAQKKLKPQTNSKSRNIRKQDRSNSLSEYNDDYSDDNESDDSDNDKNVNNKRVSNTSNPKKKNKHAPTETSSKKPVSKIRKLEGMNPKYVNGLHQDIRFDAAFGKADLQEARKNYGFLDDYRQKEIDELQRMIKGKKTFNTLPYHEQNEIRFQLQSLKSRLDTMKNRDLQTKILDDYKKEQMDNFRSGKQAAPYFLKKTEQRKLIQKAKFESMKPAQREKVMERKRKRKLGKEFKQLEFNQ